MNVSVDSARIMDQWQVTIPADVRKALGVDKGDQVSFIIEGDTVRLSNTAVYAMRRFQEEMSGEAERVGLTSEEDIMKLVKEVRNEI